MVPTPQVLRQTKEQPKLAPPRALMIKMICMKKAWISFKNSSKQEFKRVLKEWIVKHAQKMVKPIFKVHTKTHESEVNTVYIIYKPTFPPQFFLEKKNTLYSRDQKDAGEASRLRYTYHPFKSFYVKYLSLLANRFISKISLTMCQLKIKRYYSGSL